MLDETRAGRTSALAFFALACGIAAGVLAWCSFSAIQLMRWSEIFFEPTRMSHEAGHIVALVLAIVTVAPAVGAGIFWLAARAAIRDSNGTVRGVALYRTGLVVAILSILVTVAGDASVVGAAERGRREAKSLPESSLATEAENWYAEQMFEDMLRYRVHGGYRQDRSVDLTNLREFAQMAVPLKNSPFDYVYVRHARSMTVQDARVRLKGVGRLDEALANPKLKPVDRIVIAPLKPVEGIDPESLARTFFVFQEGEREYVYYFFRDEERGPWHWVPLEQPRYTVLGGRPKHACDECPFESDRPGTCPRHGPTEGERWYVCERDWLRSSEPGTCTQCNAQLQPRIRE